MKIKNVSAKVIGIVGKPLLPDQEIPVNSDLLNNASIQACVRMGMLVIDDSEERENEIKEKALAEARAQIEAEMAAKEEEKPKRRTRKTVTVENAEEVAE